LTDTKAFDFKNFRDALDINSKCRKGKISKIQRDELLYRLLKKKAEKGVFKAPWKRKKNLSPYSFPNKGWILGFTEAEGSFY
jgi:hypothetical protein